MLIYYKGKILHICKYKVPGSNPFWLERKGDGSGRVVSLYCSACDKKFINPVLASFIPYIRVLWDINPDTYPDIGHKP